MRVKEIKRKLNVGIILIAISLMKNALTSILRRTVLISPNVSLVKNASTYILMYIISLYYF
jgi:hypothetical protein